MSNYKPTKQVLDTLAVEDYIKPRQPTKTELGQLRDYEIFALLANDPDPSRDPKEAFEVIEGIINDSCIAVFDAVPPGYRGKVMLVCWPPDTDHYIAYTWRDGAIQAVQQNSGFAKQYFSK